MRESNWSDHIKHCEFSFDYARRWAVTRWRKQKTLKQKKMFSLFFLPSTSTLTKRKKPILIQNEKITSNKCAVKKCMYKHIGRESSNKVNARLVAAVNLLSMMTMLWLAYERTTNTRTAKRRVTKARARHTHTRCSQDQHQYRRTNGMNERCARVCEPREKP